MRAPLGGPPAKYNGGGELAAARTFVLRESSLFAALRASIRARRAEIRSSRSFELVVNGSSIVEGGNAAARGGLAAIGKPPLPRNAVASRKRPHHENIGGKHP